MSPNAHLNTSAAPNVAALNGPMTLPSSWDSTVAPTEASHPAPSRMRSAPLRVEPQQHVHEGLGEQSPGRVGCGRKDHPDPNLTVDWLHAQSLQLRDCSASRAAHKIVKSCPKGNH